MGAAPLRLEGPLACPALAVPGRVTDKPSLGSGLSGGLKHVTSLRSQLAQ